MTTESGTSRDLSEFNSSGIQRFKNANVFFVDPVRVLNRSYTRFRVSPSLYYSRLFESKQMKVSSSSRKRKRKPYVLNEKELASDQRHRDVRSLLMKAHEYLLGSNDLLLYLNNLRSDDSSFTELESCELLKDSVGQSFLELAKVWQAPMYEITLHSRHSMFDGGSEPIQNHECKVASVFNNLIANETSDDVEAEFLESHYIIPRQSYFYMSDLTQIGELIPDDPDYGFNLILIDPPWENRSAHQKSLYPTLPNRYFLSLPIKELTHAKGALVALWVTNREKLRNFVEQELFPKWEVKHVATFHWLKVRTDGSLISELDLFHHRPYECLLLGYCHGKVLNDTYPIKLAEIPDNQVIISVPGEYSRKPPIGELLQKYVPGSKHRCIELFAREMHAGWTSWGNEPLHLKLGKILASEASACRTIFCSAFEELKAVIDGSSSTKRHVLTQRKQYGDMLRISPCFSLVAKLLEGDQLALL